MIESLLQAEVAQVVGAEFIAQETGELFVLFEEGVLPVRPKNVVAMFDLVDDGGKFSVKPLVDKNAGTMFRIKIEEAMAKLFLQPQEVAYIATFPVLEAETDFPCINTARPSLL